MQTSIGMKWIIKGLWLAFLWLFGAQAGAAPAERLFFLNNGQVLQACVYKPQGKGPFPTVVFNEPRVNPLPTEGVADPFPELGKFYTSNKYVLFVTGRHHSPTPPQGTTGEAAANRENFMLRSNEQEAEVIFSALATLKAQSYVDADRIYVTGYSSGANATLLLSEKEMDVRGYVVFSPGSQLWTQYSGLRTTLERAVANAGKPVFLIQPENDYGLLPSKVLGKILEQKGAPNRTKVFPAFGTTQKEANSFASVATAVWGADVLAFFRELEK
jgi:dienelactone hydrolase